MSTMIKKRITNAHCCALRLVVTVAALTAMVVDSQRIKQGCYDAVGISCFKDISHDLLATDEDVEEICAWLATEVFPIFDVFADVYSHREYINGFDPDSEECRRIDEAYSQCIFCSKRDEILGCAEGALWEVCGDQPTLQEVLADSENTMENLQDFDHVCIRLEESYNNNVIDFYGAGGMPTTKELCKKQQLVRHLCPGYCEGGCFDGPTGTPPSCDPDRYKEEVDVDDDSPPWWVVCDFLHFDYIYYSRNDSDISTHADYLKAIPGNTSFCHQAQQAYAKCFWCATDRCFDNENPPSCDKKTDLETLEMTLDEIDGYCSIILSHLALGFDRWAPEFHNTSLHQDVLLFGKDPEFCPKAQEAYPYCTNCYDPSAIGGGSGGGTFCITGDWCREDAQIPNDFVLESMFADLNMTANPDITCNDTYRLWEERWYNPHTVDACYRDLWLHRQCPQNFCDFEPLDQVSRDYLGASTEAQKKALVWMSRASAILSFMGAAFVLYDILSNRNYLKELYYELLAGMATFDIVTALAWLFATAPIDEAAASHVYGARGTEQTCTAQAFFIQLGFTSIFYNVSLAVYYVLVVAYGWKEFQLKPYRSLMHGLPVLIGLGLALGGIPIYHWLEYGCHIQTWSDSEGNLWEVLLFVVLPIGFSIAAITASMLVVYCNVRKHSRRAGKWRLSGKAKAATLERQVFWQCVSFALAFYITWPIVITIYLTSADVNGPLGLTITVAFVAPLQGFSNFLVYIRPRLKTSTTSQGNHQSGSFHLSSRRSLRSSLRLRGSFTGRGSSSFLMAKQNPIQVGPTPGTKDNAMHVIDEVSSGNHLGNLQSQDSMHHHLSSLPPEYSNMDPSVLITKVPGSTIVDEDFICNTELIPADWNAPRLSSQVESEIAFLSGEDHDVDEVGFMSGEDHDGDFVEETGAVQKPMGINIVPDDDFHHLDVVEETNGGANSSDLRKGEIIYDS